ncbi:MAG TPA: 3-oxoacyl-[acyl-carrier-protein] reductase [Anaerolineae bacterium]|nr:3-oxoacyl-[acyl-carrier-protein] reductase [Anaerolineae bacterium]
MSQLDDKVAVITGAAQGIGKAIAELLARRGAQVVVADLNLEKAQATAQTITDSTGCRAIAVRVNVADSASAQAMVDHVMQEFGRIDILVNNAGTTRDNLIVRISDADWDLVLGVNLKGAFNCSKAVVRSMMKQRYGRIINISSVSGLAGQAGQTNYSSSKAGLIGFTKALAKEVGSRGITVNAVAPGFVPTDLTSEILVKVQDEAIKMTPLGRLGSVEDIAYAVAFLVSDEASFITGQVLSVDGGLAMQ